VAQVAVCTTNGKYTAGTARPIRFVYMIAGKESAKIVAQVRVCTTIIKTVVSTAHPMHIANIIA